MRFRAWLLLGVFVPVGAAVPLACGGDDSGDLPSVDASSADGSQATDGGARDAAKDGDAPACVRVTSQGAQKLMDLVVVIDNSGSIGLKTDAGAPWTLLRNAFLAKLGDAPETHGIAAQANYFPMAATAAACAPAQYEQAYVATTALPSARLGAAGASLPPNGGSTVVEGLNGGYAIAAKAHAASNRELVRLLIVTDGTPGTCANDGGAPSINAAQAAAQSGVLTQVVLLPTSAGLEPFANDLADAGGTGSAIVVDTNDVDASVAAEVSALRQPMGTAVSCVLPAPSDLGDGGPPMAHTRLTVFVTAEGGTRVTVPYVDTCPSAVPTDAGVKDAGPTADGGTDAGAPAPSAWTEIDGNVVLCAALCDEVASQRSARVEIGVDCP